MTRMIVHYDDYSVSDDGRVFSKYGKELSQNDNGRGYMYVQICGKNGKRKAYVHRLVAKAFLENEEGKRCVNHKDGNKKNNSFLNLEWCTHEENTKHAAEQLKVLKQYEESNEKRRKPVIGTYVSNPLEEKEYCSISAASVDRQCSKSVIIAALKGRQQTAAGMYWRYGQK